MPEWRDWDNRGGSMKFGPAMSHWGFDNIQYFIVDKGTDHLLMSEARGFGFGGWTDIGGLVSESPAAVCWGPGRIDIFHRGRDNALWWKFRDNGQWTEWSSLDGVLTSAPTVASWGQGRLDVFARGQDNALWHRGYEGGTWSGWESLGGNLVGAPSALSQAPGHIIVVAKISNDPFLQSRRFWNGKWEPWFRHDIGLPAAPALASWGRDRIDWFITEANQQVWHRWFAGNEWSTFELIGGPMYSQPAAVAPIPDRFIVAARGPGDSLFTRSYN